MAERMGRLVLDYRIPADLPSRSCRWFGHRFTTETARRGPSLEHIYRSCDRCGFTEKWIRPEQQRVSPGHEEAR